jgi:hypothetical protein
MTHPNQRTRTLRRAVPGPGRSDTPQRGQPVAVQQEWIRSTAASATPGNVPPSHTSTRLSEGRRDWVNLGPQVHVQADGGASGTGADLDQIADLLDDPQPAAAPGRDRIPF